jgi:hypothetical protein
VQKRLCDAIAAGNTRNDAAEYAGVGESTLRRWLAQGRRRRSGKFRALLAAVKKAEADAVVRNVAIIQKAASTSWQAAAWWLERKRDADWSQCKGLVRRLAHEVQELKRVVRGRSAA